jgi:hypothetical protein
VNEYYCSIINLKVINSMIKSIYKKIVASGLAVFLITGGLLFPFRENLSEPLSDVPVVSRTEILDPAAEKLLLGKHNLTLQWVGWEIPGSALVEKRGALLHIKGEQSDQKEGNFLQMEGEIVKVMSRSFQFRGVINTKVSFLNNGNECRREGLYTFSITGKRRYWRMVEMQNPCEDVVDYVDLYLR